MKATLTSQAFCHVTRGKRCHIHGERVFSYRNAGSLLSLPRHLKPLHRAGDLPIASALRWLKEIQWGFVFLRLFSASDGYSVESAQPFCSAVIFSGNRLWIVISSVTISLTRSLDAIACISPSLISAPYKERASERTMMRNLLPKIVLGVILVLLALHFTVSNIDVKSEGTWTQPKFSFSLKGSSSSIVVAPPTTATEAAKNEKPPSMWEDLETSADVVTADLPVATAEIPVATSATHESASPSVQASESTASSIIPTASHIVNSTETQTASQSAAHVVPTQEVNPHANHGDESKLPCSELEGADDVVFIIKTGATELEEKIPVHFNTTLRCFPKSLIYSDHSENFEGHIIHDALGNVIDQIRLQEDQFDLWRRLHEKGRASLDPSELSINDHGSNLGGGGNPDNGGWALDKYKNIPMVNYTIHRYPDTKWFVYTDADTFIMWSNLLKWVKQMDSKRLVYLGSPAQIGDQTFGHGGSGYVISNALMHKAAKEYNKDQSKWDKYALTHWAGDCVLATMLEILNGKLSWAYPMIQGGDNTVMDYWETGYNKRLWCYPAISYHHITPQTIASLWHFEQEWLANSTTKEIYHGDVYKQWYLPQLPHERDGWDNMSEDDMRDSSITDAWGCRDACQHNTTCMQWSFSDGGCNFHQTTKIGKLAENVHSGWILDRINEKVAELDKCDEGEWIMPDYHGSKHKRRAMEVKRSDHFR